jgi:enoyl-CoA hydratase/carnithine racemase
MMGKVKLIIEKGDDSKKIARIVFNYPQNLNAIDRDLYQKLNSSLDILADRDDIGVLILSSEVEEAFSAGVDVKFVQKLTNEEAGHFFEDLSGLFDKLARLPLPTMAYVHGYTFGAGADLALACDVRIASPSAVFRCPGPQFGLILGTLRLINEIGASKARYVTLTNKKISSQTALEYGLVHIVCEERNEAEDLIANWAQKLLGIPADTVQTLKQLCNRQQIQPDLTKKSVLSGDFGQRFYEYTKK